MNEVLETIRKIGIIPVVTIENVEEAAPLAKALCNGGLPCAEVTFRTSAAKEAIQKMINEYPNMIIGAGTVLNTSQVDEAVEAGARFIVSPGLNPNIVKYCINKGVVIIPGCSNPSDIEQAIELGIDTVKFFPAEAAGGLKMIKAMSAPYRDIKFMPTGGINVDNLKSYLKFNKVIACGGTWMVSRELINGGRFEEIESITRDAVETMLGFELLHIGINTSSNDIATTLNKLFGFKNKENSKPMFLNNDVNTIKSSIHSKNGYLEIGTNNINRAIWYLNNNGYEIDENTKILNENGILLSIYLKEEIGGYAIKLIQK